MEKTKVYVLVNPITLKIRYVGITKSGLSKRVGDHIFEAKKNYPKTHKDNWIMSLLKYGERPIIRKIAEFDTREEARELEIKLIDQYKVKHQLTNCIDEGKFKATGKKSARVYLTKPVYLYDYDGNYVKKYDSSVECQKDLGINEGTMNKIFYRKDKRGLSMKHKFQLSRTKFDSVSPLLNYSNRSIIP